MGNEIKDFTIENPVRNKYIQIIIPIRLVQCVSKIFPHFRSYPRYSAGNRILIRDRLIYKHTPTQPEPLCAGNTRDDCEELLKAIVVAVTLRRRTD